jgi:hypothetical protein
MRRSILLIAFCACFLGGSIERDEFLCEEAHARLLECCPGFTRKESTWCKHEYGCDSASDPALSESESTCIRESSCNALVANHVCERANVRTEREGDAAPQAVCP